MENYEASTRGLAVVVKQV